MLTFLWVVGSACTDQPRDGSVPQTRNQTYSGYYPGANVRVSVQIKKVFSSEWKEFSWSTTSPTAAFTDACGVAWHSWSAHVTLPLFNSPYWHLVPFGLPTVYLRTRAVAAGGTVLASFNENADACLQQQTCGNAAAVNCGNGDGEISLSCGFPCGWSMP
jgi:hypothetical protein